MDVHSKKQRSYNMSQIKSKNTQPEMIIRKLLWNNGLRYRLHKKELPGKPDIVFIKKKKAIFINGCFWHKHNCDFFKWPKTRTDFWRNKINNNFIRDKRNYKKLKELGWDVLIIWECEINQKDQEQLINRIIGFIK